MPDQKEFLVAQSSQVARACATVDYGWTPVRSRNGRLQWRKPDGTLVEYGYNDGFLRGLPQGTVVHLGYGCHRNAALSRQCHLLDYLEAVGAVIVRHAENLKQGQGKAQFRLA